MPTRDEIITGIRYSLQMVSEGLKRVQTLPFASSERIKRIRELQAQAEAHAVRAEELRLLPASDEIAELSIKKHAVAQAHHQLTDYVDKSNVARQRIQLSPEDSKHLFQRDLEQLQARIVEIQNEVIPELHREINNLESTRIPRALREVGGKEADHSLTQLELDVKNLVDIVKAFEEGESRGASIDAGVFLDFDAKGAEFEKSSDYHRRQGLVLLIAMVAIVMLGAAAIACLFLNIPVEVKGAVGELERFKAFESVVLTGAGRIAVLGLIAWALSYVGGLYRVHSEQAVLYRDKRAALGVVTNVLRAAETPKHKHKLLQSVARGYLRFEHSAFKPKQDSQKRKSRSSPLPEMQQVKELIEFFRPLLGVDSRSASRAKAPKRKRPAE